jgi:uncharacterized protein YabE (DUF348 family)/3D (Asp-Asp-Asp) domain-containing protein
MRSKPSRSARSLKTQYLFAAAIPALIVTLSITGFVWAQKQVTVVADGQTSRFKTQATDVASLLNQADIVLGAGDVVTPAVSSPVSGGMTVLVRHATPVTLNLAGTSVPVNVVGTSVADALVAAGIDPAANPAVTPQPAAALRPGMTIIVPKVFARVSHEDVVVPFGQRTIHDPALPAGVRSLVTKGRAGTSVRLFRALVANGVEGPRVLAAEKIVAPPVDEVVAIGSASRSVGNRAICASAKALRGVRSLKAPARGRRIVAEVTGYTPGDAGVNHTCATGAYATHGVVAVDPHVIPLGTHVFIPGYGYAIAADTGGAIKGNRIDLCFDTRDECIQWGRRTVTVIILD